MENKARLSLYLRDEKLRRQIKIAATKRGMSISDYCMKAIERQLLEDGEVSIREAYTSSKEYKASLGDRIEKLRREVGPIDVSVSEFIKEGRRR